MHYFSGKVIPCSLSWQNNYALTFSLSGLPDQELNETLLRALAQVTRFCPEQKMPAGGL